MSRIGKAPVIFEPSVQVSVASGNTVTVKGAKASQVVKMSSEITAKVEGNRIVLVRKNDERQVRALHGLYRALVQNAVTGVTRGFSKSLELVGVGYRANVAGKKLEMTLGFSHPVVFEIPDGIEIKVEKSTLVHVSGANKSQVGEVSAKIRSFRPPEPYLGKGVKYVDERIRRKAGKAAGK